MSSHWPEAFAFIFAPLVLVAFSVAPGLAEGPPLTPTRSLYDRVLPSVVSITVSGRDAAPTRFGSGVILSADGVVLTNYHVVEEGVFFDITLAGVPKDQPPVQARPFQCAPEQDLATLRMVPTSGLKPARLAMGTPSIGDRVFALGSPMGLEGTLSDGIVSQLRQVGGRVLIQTTTPVSHGSSGGGLFLSDGRLVGITTLSVAEGQALNFAVALSGMEALARCESFPPYAANAAPPTPQPEPAATPCKPNLVLDQMAPMEDAGVASFHPPRMWIRIQGIVLNKGCGLARYVKVKVEATQGGTYLTSASAYTDDPMIQPGERSHFKVFLEHLLDTTPGAPRPSYSITISSLE